MQLSRENKIHLVWAAIAAGLLTWADVRPEPAPVNVAMPAAPAPEVAKTPKAETPVAFKAVKAYPKSVKPKLGMPAHVQADDNKLVIEAVKLPADEHTQTVTTVIDIQTGEAETFFRRDPYPLLALNYSGDAGAYLGFKNGIPALRVEARQSFLTVKAIHLGAIGSIDQPLGSMFIPPAVFIGAGLWRGWK